MSWDLLKRFIESDVFNQNPFLSVAYLSYGTLSYFAILARLTVRQTVRGSCRYPLCPLLEAATVYLPRNRVLSAATMPPHHKR
jgi:hypothetical protein